MKTNIPRETMNRNVEWSVQSFQSSIVLLPVLPYESPAIGINAYLEHWKRLNNSGASPTPSDGLDA